MHIPDRQTHDRVLTIAIGDLDRDGRTIPNGLFQRAAVNVVAAVERHGGTLYACTYGEGVTSDQPYERAERTAVVLAGNVRNVVGLRHDVEEILQSINGSSACFAIDRTHEPVFA